MLCASVRIIRYCIGAVIILLTRSPTAGSESDQVPLLSGSVVPAVEWVKVRAEWPGLMVMVAAQLVNVSVEYKSREGEMGNLLDVGGVAGDGETGDGGAGCTVLATIKLRSLGGNGRGRSDAGKDGHKTSEGSGELHVELSVRFELSDMLGS